MLASHAAHDGISRISVFLSQLKSGGEVGRSSDPLDPPRDETSGREMTPRRRRRRWPAILLMVVLLIAAIALTTPYWLSSGPATRLIVSLANQRLVGRIDLGDLKLNWRGPSEVHDLTVFDPAGREVLRARRVRIEAGLWKLLRFDPSQLGEVTIWEPHVLALVEDGQLTLGNALRSREPAPGEELPDIRGRVVIRDGQVAYALNSGQQPYQINDLDAEVTLASLNDIALKATCASSDGGRLTAESTLRELFPKHQIDWAAARGSLKLTTDEKFDLEPVAALFAPDAAIAGRGELQVDAQISDGRLTGRFEARAYQLHSRGAYAVTIRPIDLVLAGNVEADRQRASGSLAIQGEPGRILGRFDYQHGEGIVIRPRDLPDAALNGTPLAWPDLTVRTEGELDLPVLARAVPSLLQIRRDVEITRGRLELGEIVVQFGRLPAASGVVRLSSVEAQREGRAIALEPITASFDLHIVEDQGLAIQRGVLASGFGEAHASGNMSRLKLELDSDLAKIHSQLAQVWDLGPQELAGGVSADIELVSDRAAGTFQTQGRIWCRDLQAVTNGRRLSLREAKTRFGGHGTQHDGRVDAITLTEATFDAEQQLAATLSGHYAMTDGRLDLNVKVSPTSWSYLAARLQDWDVAIPGDYQGKVALISEARRASAQEPILTKGRLVVVDLERDDRLLLPGESVLAWEEGRLAPAAKSFYAAQASLQSEPVTATVRELAYEAGKLSGQIETHSQLQRLLDLLTAIQGWDQPPPLAGQLLYRGRIRCDGPVWAVSGEGQIEDAVLGSGETAVRDPQVRFALDVRGNAREDRLDVENVRVDSRLVALRASGQVADYTGRRELDLTCAYQAEWAPILSLLHEMAPATAQVLAVRGRTSDEFRLSGAINDPQAQPAYRHLRAEPAVRWDAAELFGIRLGAASLRPVLADARVNLPGSAIPASGGELNLVGQIDLAAPEPVLRIPGRHTVLRNVQVDPQMSRELLSRLNPVFGDVSQIEGTASLELADVVLPLGPDKSRSAGSGRLTTSQIRVQPKKFFALLLEIGSRFESRVGGAGMYSVRMSDLNFTMNGGVIAYRDFTMYFADNDLDVKFSGTVNLDGQVNLIASIPVRSGLLQRFGVAGPVAQYARMLEGVRVEIPVTGSRLAPQLDLASVDIKPLLAQAAQKGISEEARRALAPILGEPAAPDGDRTARPRPRSPAEEAEGLLRGLLGDERRREPAPREQRRRR